MSVENFRGTPCGKLHNAVLITGAGQRIGHYLARKFLEETDWPVLFTYRTPRPGVTELEAAGARGLMVDLTVPDAAEKVARFVADQAVSLRALIHNASLWLKDEALATSPAQLQALVRLHMQVPYELNRLLVSFLRAASADLKDIISLSDFNTERGSDQHAFYLATKAGLQNLTKSFAKLYAPAIKVNDIAPALIMFNEGDPPAYRAQRLQKSLLQIEPGPEVVWQTVRFIMQNPYLTAMSIPLDGGRSVV